MEKKDIKKRLDDNLQKLRDLQAALNKIEEEKQNILQEVLRLDGENRLLKELEKEPS